MPQTPSPALQPTPPSAPLLTSRFNPQASQSHQDSLQDIFHEFNPIFHNITRNAEVTTWDFFEQHLIDLTSRVSSHIKSGNQQPARRWWKNRRRNRARREESSATVGCHPPPASQNHCTAPDPQVQPPAPPATQPPRRAPGRKRKSEKAASLQRLYRSNPKKCMKTILNKESKRCPISTANVCSHFHQTNGSSANTNFNSTPTPEWLYDSTSREDILDSQFLSKEVSDQIRRMPNTSSPGPDRITYNVWKRLDPKGVLLTNIFEFCRIHRRVPASWKSSSTILIYKKGDPEYIRNWRPICLQNTIYKLYTATIAKRIAQWANATGAISHLQRGFMPFDGIMQHSFVLRSIMEDSRRKRKNLNLVWIDLRDAFGSIPYDTLWIMMERNGLTGRTLDIIQDIYTNSQTRISVDQGQTDPIISQRGVKQGCPLSPILFNLVIEGLLKRIQSLESGGYFISDHLIRILAYADDICLITEDKKGLREMMDALEEFATWGGLSFNTRKCASLSLKNKGSKKYTKTFSPLLCGEPIPALKWTERYKYLGNKLGADPSPNLEDLASDIHHQSTKIFASDLTDWQKMDAYRRFVFPMCDHHFKSALPYRKWCQNLDKSIRVLVKRHLKIPRRALTTFIHLKSEKGGLGLPSFSDKLDCSLTLQCFTLLACENDAIVRDIAMQQLEDTVRIRSRINQPSHEDLTNFLRSDPQAQEGREGDLRNLWSSCRKALKSTEAKVLLDNDTVTLAVDNEAFEWKSRKAISKKLQTVLHRKKLNDIENHKDQGKVITAAALHPSSNAWIKDGKYTTFGQYRFSIKARLDLLPVGSVKERMRKCHPGSGRCSSCGIPKETLPHTLNHCPPNMPLIRERHNSILDRLTKAVPDIFLKFKEQVIPGDTDQLKPDLVLVNSETRKGFIIDVTIPFDDSQDALKAARQKKKEKYEHLKPLLKQQHQLEDVTVDAFVIGSLGSWDPDNDDLLPDIGIGRNYSTLFRRLCVMEAIKGSHSIWKKRCKS